EQIKRLKAEHKKIKSQHKKLEEKQHEVLASMGENIHALAQESMSHSSRVVDKIKDVSSDEDIEKMKYNDSELLDVTGDLIKFLRLKSKKVLIQNEVFNFNHVLNEVAGTLHNIYKNNDIELIFDIDKEVPKSMLADSLHMGQILSNLLEYVIQNAQSKEVKLEVTTEHSLTEGLQLCCRIESEIVIPNQETLFDSYYDEELRRYVGLGLFVAKELTELMQGELIVVDTNEGYNALVIHIPIVDGHQDKRKYRLPDKGLVGKKILIVDVNANAAAATEKLFAYFKADVTVLSAEKYAESMPNIGLYDIVALNETLFSLKMIAACKSVKETQDLKIIALENLFSSHEGTLDAVVDFSLKKPLTQEYVFDTLIELYTSKEEKLKKREKEDENALLVYRKNFKHTENVGLESFSSFSGKHVLIVEDNEINQKVLLSILAKSGMVLHIANNGEEAVDFMLTEKEKIDFIFMDINMPVMDGYIATQHIRRDARFNEVPIVALTALVADHEIDKMFDMGMNGYLPKPLHIEKLYTALDMFLTTASESEEKIESTVSPTMKLEGLDLEEGLRRMKGNEVFYKEVLKEFLDAYAQSDEVFESLVKEQRFVQVNMLLLDMKGLTGTIGAMEMHDLLSEIQQKIIYNKEEIIDTCVASFSKTFTTLKTAIETFLAA
ncbi:MAG: response regulator, partial [Sulfurovum sp.]|nr:response regulator [Sulfurovum sp.]